MVENTLTCPLSISSVLCILCVIRMYDDFSYTDVEHGEIEMRGLESAAAAAGNRASSGAAAGGGGEVRNTEL